jgi:hypothetical protein
MHTCTSLLIIAVLALQPLATAAQPRLSPEAEVAAFKQMAAGIPLGSRIVVRTKEGRRLRATLMAVEDERIVVKRDSRVPEPAVEVAFSDLARLERESKGGFSFVKALGIGLAAGVGAILTLFAIAVSVDD